MFGIMEWSILVFLCCYCYGDNWKLLILKKKAGLDRIILFCRYVNSILENV